MGPGTHQARNGKYIGFFAPIGAAFARDNRCNLYNAALDFFLVGGGSLLFYLGMVLFFPHNQVTAATSVLAFNITYLINDPHFTISYQLLYADLWRVLRAENTRIATKVRYFFAGIVVPCAIIAYCTFCFLNENLFLLAYVANAMLFFVGWHYIKQGYGVLITYSVLNKYFLNATEKILLRFNLYLVWALSWLMANDRVSSSEFRGISVVNLSAAFGITPVFTHVAVGAVVVSTLVVIGVFLHKYLREGRAPSLNGLVGYVMSSYGWLLLVIYNPLFLLFTPMFHSLQYLALALRYEFNKTGQSLQGAVFSRIFNNKALLKFILTGLALGYVLFHFIPDVLQRGIPYSHTIFGASIFAFMIVAFVNIHHYFIDNVIWRKDNENVRKYLFSTLPAKV